MSAREQVAAELFGTRIGTDYISLYDAEALADVAIAAHLGYLTATGHVVVKCDE